MAGAVVVLSAAQLLTGVPPAFAEEPAAPPPALMATSSITSPASDAFIPQNSFTVTGTKEAGSTVTVTVAGTAGCSAPAGDEPLTSWGCTTALPNGEGIAITATETLPDLTTRTRTVAVDVLGAPTVDPAPPQTAPGVASGTGYEGATIHLRVDGTIQDCHAVVTGGRWRCTIANGPGTHSVTAQQSAPMGRSSASQAVTLQVDPAPVTPPPPASPPPAHSAPVLPPPAPPHEQPQPSPSANPGERADAPTPPWLDRPFFPGPGGDGPTVREALTNWGTPTEFGADLPSPRETVTGGNWVWGPVLALTFIGLVAIPLRLLATTLRGRVTFRAPQLTGRNRAVFPVDDVTPRNPWLAGAVPLAVTAGLIVFAEGLGGEVRYLRLLLAAGIGLAILNVVGVALATRFASTRLRAGGGLRFRPILLLAAAVATVLSRATGLDVPIVGGVLIGAGFVLGVPTRPRALVNLAQVSAVLALALLAWLGHSAIGPVEGFWASTASETLATVCLAGLGSALILILPIGALPGRVVLEWSQKAWFASALTVGTVVFAIILGRTQSPFPMLASALIVTGFAAVCVAVWAWANYAEVSRVFR